MPDRTPELLPRLISHRLTSTATSGLPLELGDGFVYPAYADQSILNIPSSVCRLLGVPEFQTPQSGVGALIPEILSPLLEANGGKPYRRVLLLLMDALALHRLQRWIEDGDLPFWKERAQEGLLAPLTSIVPSTTSAALTSLWTGRSAAEHGIAGYELWLKEYGVVANMILHSPMSFQINGSLPGSLSYAGFQPEAFLQLPTLGTHLAAHGVVSYAFQHYSIIHSGLSRMFFHDVHARSFSTPADLMINLRQLLESRLSQSCYVWLYWGEVDHLSHFYGPDDEHPRAEFAGFSAALESLLYNRLSAQARRETLLILTADHGQITTRPDAFYDLHSYPSLARRLHINPTGENRLAYLYPRTGQGEAVREHIERTWPGMFTMLDPAFAVEAGLFGPGPRHPLLFDRLGDQLLLSRGDSYLWWTSKENHLIGRHGGLYSEEMLVPFLAVRL
jgi:hypothetical protein